MNRLNFENIFYDIEQMSKNISPNDFLVIDITLVDNISYRVEYIDFQPIEEERLIQIYFHNQYLKLYFDDIKKITYGYL